MNPRTVIFASAAEFQPLKEKPIDPIIADILHSSPPEIPIPEGPTTTKPPTEEEIESFLQNEEAASSAISTNQSPNQRINLQTNKQQRFSLDIHLDTN
jgi:hypothetical protein